MMSEGDRCARIKSALCGIPTSIKPMRMSGASIAGERFGVSASLIPRPRFPTTVDGLHHRYVESGVWCPPVQISVQLPWNVGATNQIHRRRNRGGGGGGGGGGGVSEGGVAEGGLGPPNLGQYVYKVR